MLSAKENNEKLPERRGPLFSTLSTISLIGLSTYLTWSICRIIPTLFPSPQELAAEIISLTDIPHSFAYVLVLIVLGFFLLEKMKRVHKRIFAIALSVLLCIGTGLFYLSGWSENVIPAGIWIGSLIIATEMGLLLLWGEVYASLPIEQCCVNTAIAYVGAFASCIVIVQLSPAFCILIHTILPFISGFLLFVSYGEINERSIGNTLGKSYASRESMRLPLKFLIGFAILAFLQLLTSDLSEHATSHTTELNSLIGGLISSVAATLLAFAFPRKKDFGAIYRIFMPAIIICVVLALIADPGAPPYEIYAVAACWAFFRIATWIMWCFLTNKLNISPFYMFAAGQIALSLGGIVEKAVKPLLLVLPDPISALFPIIIILSLVTGSILLNERHIVELFTSSNAGSKRSAEQTPEQNPDKIAVQNAAAFFHLSQREQEIAEMIISGKDNSEIEKTLFIAPSTLKTHMRNMYSKCEVHNKQDLISSILAHGEDKEGKAEQSK